MVVVYNKKKQQLFSQALNGEFDGEWRGVAAKVARFFIFSRQSDTVLLCFGIMGRATPDGRRYNLPANFRVSKGGIICSMLWEKVLDLLEANGYIVTRQTHDN